MTWYAPTRPDGSFEFFVGPGAFYFVGPDNADQPKFEITDQQEFEINIHAPGPATGPISGRVILASEPKEAVAEAIVTGVPIDSSLRGLSAVSAADGRFEAERVLGEMLVHAETKDRRLAKIAADDRQVVLPLSPTATAHGHLIDTRTGEALPDRAVEYGVWIQYKAGTFNWKFGGKSQTDGAGAFKLDGLVVGQEYVLEVRTEQGTWSTAGRVKPDRAEAIDLGDITFREPARRR